MPYSMPHCESCVVIVVMWENIIALVVKYTILCSYYDICIIKVKHLTYSWIENRILQ